MKPDSSQLKHLANDPVMRWVLGQLNESFKPLASHHAAPSWDMHLRLVGNQEVLWRLRNLLNEENI